MWSFPYYLIGTALVGLTPSFGNSVGQRVDGEAWLILLPLVYLVHFYVGPTYAVARISPDTTAQPGESLPLSADMNNMHLIEKLWREGSGPVRPENALAGGASPLQLK